MATRADWWPGHHTLLPPFYTVSRSSFDEMFFSLTLTPVNTVARVSECKENVSADSDTLPPADEEPKVN